MKVAIIGAGNMGGAIARGLAQGTIIPASDVTVADPFKGCRYRYSGCKTVVDRSGIECDSFDSSTSISFYRRRCNL